MVAEEQMHDQMALWSRDMLLVVEVATSAMVDLCSFALVVEAPGGAMATLASFAPPARRRQAQRSCHALVVEVVSRALIAPCSFALVVEAARAMVPSRSSVLPAEVVALAPTRS